MVHIRRAESGDENILAHIQTESWKEAFKDIISADLLLKCTESGHVAEIYKKILQEQKGNGYILELDGKPHCIAWWDASRENDMPGYAELICIHSLMDNWHKGYGNMMMKQVLKDVKAAGYSKIMLWVFDDNVRAIKFYENQGFVASGKKQPALGAVEEMYVCDL